MELFSDISDGLKRVFAINIMFALCYYLVAPLFPLFLESLQLSESQIGLVLGVGSFSGVISTMLSGYLTDKLGSKSLFLVTVLGYGVSVLLVALTGDWILITLFWVVFNASQSIFEPVRLSYIGENTTKENQGKMYGFMNLAWPISGVIGPILSGKLAEILGWTQTFVIAAILCLLAVLPSFALDTPKKEERTAKPKIESKYLWPLAQHFVFHVLLTTGIGIMYMAVPIYLAHDFGLDYTVIGMFFTVSNLITILTQIPSGSLADRYGMKKTTMIALSIVPLSSLIWVLSRNWLMLLLSNSLIMGLWSMTWGATTVLVTSTVPDSLRGTAISVRMTGYRVGYTLGPIIAGSLFTRFGGVSPFTFATLVFALALPIGMRFKEVNNIVVPTLVSNDD